MTSNTLPWVWGATVAVLCLLWCVVARFCGPQRAMGCQVIVACLVPTWAQLDLADSLWLDCRMAATVFGLVAYCFHPKATFPWRLGWLDASMISLLVIHIVSDIDNTGWTWAIPFRVYGEWCVAYLAGRLALQNLEDFRYLTPWAISVAIFLALGSIFEAVSSDHPWEALYGERKYDGIDRGATRWLGMTRAWGCCAHPIYFGFLQVLFLPWLLRAWHRTLVQPSNSGWFMACVPLLGVAGVFCTGSRAALGAYLLVMLLGLLAYVPTMRIVFLLVALVAAPLAYMERGRVIDTITRMGERVNENRKIEIDGRQQQMTYTATRWMLVKVYWKALVDASWLGYGTDAISGFPVKVPVGAVDPETLKEVPYIDNQFVLMTLRFGWMGVTAFTVALLLAAVAWFQRSTTIEGSHAAVSFYVGGTILAVAAGLLTVWMPHDIGFPLLWWMGAGSSTPSKRKPEGSLNV